MQTPAITLFPSDDLSDGLWKLREVLEEIRGEALKPAPRVPLSVWMEDNFVLSASTSSEPGKIRLFGFQRGIADAITDPANSKITWMSSARVGKTSLLKGTGAYYTAADPSPVLMLQPTEEDAKDFSKSEITPMFDDMKCLAAIRNPNGRGETQDTWNTKHCTNGAIWRLRGAVSDDAFRRVTTRINCGDEVDAAGWNPSANTQGDKLKLLDKRGETFWNSKRILMSTPLLKGSSRIEAEYEKGDQRKYFVPCPHCGEMQVLEFGGRDLPHGLKWDVDEETGMVSAAYFVCAVNGCIIEESSKPAMIENGEWRPTAKPKEPGHASFHIWTAYSLFPKASWKHIAQEWLSAQADPSSLLQPFVNLWLGETWEDRAGKAIDGESLEQRTEVYEAEVPAGVAYLTAFVDFQRNRFEVEVVGWGRGEESWNIDYKVVLCDPIDSKSWESTLDDLLFRTSWRGIDGREFRIQATGLDSGDGYATQQIYDYARARISKRVWATKGQANSPTKKYPIWPGRPTLIDKKGGKVPLYIVGVDNAKDLVSRRMAIKDPGPGYMHFPVDRDKAYFEQLSAEKKIWKGHGAHRMAVWDCPKGKRNEAFDCRVGNTAVMYGLKAINISWDPTAIADRMGIPVASAEATVPSERESEEIETPATPVKPAPRPAARRRPVAVRSSFMSR